jgi:hypothetical protein
MTACFLKYWAFFFASAIVLFPFFSRTSTLLQTPAQQGGHESNINPKDMQIQLTGFLGAEPAMLFMKDLWVLLLSAQVHRFVLADFMPAWVFSLSISGKLQV